MMRPVPSVNELLALSAPPLRVMSFAALPRLASLLTLSVPAFRVRVPVKEFVPEVMLTVVDIIGEEEIKKSQAVADSVGIHLRVREYVD
jgi:hypothetical protein